ncbi:hypothetical protein GOP47_0009644 [Adiantum capillus-veneris]|uniref:BHLH domain-containing protein n=1 Tax=Adiantum capillus-veneris TaxID=13818 RepID=A0A9D4UWY4_ADICA|nr:hypothetical protein GOP47_0009644 [Adiantum capillus-veneris]
MILDLKAELLRLEKDEGAKLEEEEGVRPRELFYPRGSRLIRAVSEHGVLNEACFFDRPFPSRFVLTTHKVQLLISSFALKFRAQLMPACASMTMGAMSTSDYNLQYGDINHNQWQSSTSASGINASWGFTPTLGSLQACLHEKAQNCVAQSNNARGKNASENHINELGAISSINVEAAQLELADLLRGILDDQQAVLATPNRSDYSLSSLIKGTTTDNQFNHSAVSIINSAHKLADSDILLHHDVLDAHNAAHGQAICISKYEIAASDTLMDAESLLVMANPFHLDAAEHQSLSSSTSSSASESNYSTLACINTNCSTNNDHFSCKGNSNNIALQSCNDDLNYHQKMEPMDVGASCGVATTAGIFDDYSLSTINGAAVLGSTELLPSKMGPRDVAVLNADVNTEAFEIIVDDDNNDNNRCEAQEKTVIAVDMTTTRDYGENGSNKEDPLVASHHAESNIDVDINNCVRDDAVPGFNASCNQDYGMVSICHEEGQLYPASGSHMRLMQREVTYAAAAMQPVDWAGINLAVNAGTRPKRRNVRISEDPQTVSARRRRERISDRIRVLQRMVPGGTKLDTASMLDEAIHYLKYLKSQVQALEWLERRSSPNSTTSNLSFPASSLSPYNCLYPNFNTSYIQPSPSSRLMIIK